MGLSLENKKNIAKVVELLQKCQHILFITGAGISADSGLPTYRGISGLYNDRTTEDGIPIETALAGETLYAQPEITWKYLSRIEEKCRGAKFNRAHEVIAQMQDHFQRVWVLTQNIDGFHRAAGSAHIIDIHGDMHKLLCPACGLRIEVKDYSRILIPPHCAQCNNIMRPDVVFFGEMLPEPKIKILSCELDKGFDIYFSIGTTSVFPYIYQPMLRAKQLGRVTVEINPGETEISSMVDIKITSKSAETLHEIWEGYFNK